MDEQFREYENIKVKKENTNSNMKINSKKFTKQSLRWENCKRIYKNYSQYQNVGHLQQDYKYLALVEHRLDHQSK